MYVRYLPHADWVGHFMGPEDRYYVIVKTDKNEVISSKNLSTANVIYTLMVCFKCSVFIENLLLCICRNIFVENVVLFFDVSLWRYECTFESVNSIFSVRSCLYSKLFWAHFLLLQLSPWRFSMNKKDFYELRLIFIAHTLSFLSITISKN